MRREANIPNEFLVCLPQVGEHSNEGEPWAATSVWTNFKSVPSLFDSLIMFDDMKNDSGNELPLASVFVAFDSVTESIKIWPAQV